MNTKTQNPVQISVRDVLVSRLNVLEGRLAEYRLKFPTANFTEAKARFQDAETVLRGFNPKSEDSRLVDYNLVKGDKAMVAAILQVTVEATEKKEKPVQEVKVTTTGQFVGEQATEVNVSAVLANKNLLPLSSLRDLKAAALAPNRSRKGEQKNNSKKEESKKKGSKRVPKAEVTTKKRATK